MTPLVFAHSQNQKAKLASFLAHSLRTQADCHPSSLTMCPLHVTSSYHSAPGSSTLLSHVLFLVYLQREHRQTIKIYILIQHYTTSSVRVGSALNKTEASYSSQVREGFRQEIQAAEVAPQSLGTLSSLSPPLSQNLNPIQGHLVTKTASEAPVFICEAGNREKTGGTAAKGACLSGSQLLSIRFPRNLTQHSILHRIYSQRHIYSEGSFQNAFFQLSTLLSQ